MVRTPQDLMYGFLNQAFPCSAPPRMRSITAQEAAEFFYENAKPFQDKAEAYGYRWSDAAIVEVDEALERVADTGDFEYRLHLSHEGVVEWYYRWSYAATALVLQAQQATRFAIEVPFYAEEAIQSTALILAIMGGDARDYPPQLRKH